MRKRTRLGATAVLATLLTSSAWAQATAPAASPPTTVGTSRIVEIRSYNLKPGTRDRFHELFVNTSLPMLRRWKVDVVAFGPSEHDQDSWFLMRGFPSLEARQKSEDAFYSSDEWIKGPREAVLADIVSYATVIISIDQATLAGLRKTGARSARAEDAMSTPSSSDLTTLLKLNQDYIDSVQHSNVQRFSEILADDFLCSLPDGLLIDRAQFLSQTAKPVTISNLAAHDVNVRIMGDMAIIHARTTYNTADGKAATGRYTDVWARRNGQWLAVSAHVTRN
jgi:ketosteroid isomerase-like protein